MSLLSLKDAKDSLTINNKPHSVGLDRGSEKTTI